MNATELRTELVAIARAFSPGNVYYMQRVGNFYRWAEELQKRIINLLPEQQQGATKMNTIEEWRAVLADEKYHSPKQQAELLLRSLDAYRPYTKCHDTDVEAIVRFLTARDEAMAAQVTAGFAAAQAEVAKLRGVIDEFDAKVTEREAAQKELQGRTPYTAERDYAVDAEAEMKRHAEMEERDEQRRREEYAGERADNYSCTNMPSAYD